MALQQIVVLIPDISRAATLLPAVSTDVLKHPDPKVLPPGLRKKYYKAAQAQIELLRVASDIHRLDNEDDPSSPHRFRNVRTLKPGSDRIEPRPKSHAVRQSVIIRR
ncbi:MAG TPA: hypothetical protein VMU07_04235 [Candidatus Paceibacterota bacterium]|nr:hypothetical protein [Candidatus Paceibacterota bacterium]